MDYSIFYKEKYSDGNVSSLGPYDIFISAFDNCSRTKQIYNSINANRKIWLRFPHYKLAAKDLPTKDLYYNDCFSEDEYFLDLISSNFIEQTNTLCIDISGFIRPHLIYFLRYLLVRGIKKADLIYSEPVRYINADETNFSGFIDDIKIVDGYSASIVNPNTDKDILIITAGYDDKLFAKIAQFKRHCNKKYYILGFPSLQADFYQESILKMENARESIGENKFIKYAPAFDPFITAQIINEIIEENIDASNIYLSPLSTKSQTVGMCLYFLWNCSKKPLNIIFPYSKSYSTNHAIGVKRTWKYTFEFPPIIV